MPWARKAKPLPPVVDASRVWHTQYVRRFVPHLAFACLTLAALAWSVPVALRLPFPSGSSDYNAQAFVVRYSWVKFARTATAPLRADLSASDQDAQVKRFFELNRLIAEQERIAGDAGTDPAAVSQAEDEDKALRAERATLENNVEEILESRLTSTLRELELTRHIGGDVVWPPVNVEFEEPPAVLVESPRTEIRRADERLVRGDLTIEERLGLESKAEADGDTSALVVNIGAIALYPALVPPRADYHATLQTIAHEWVHHYLFFAPLGRNFYNGDKLVTLNETVANIVGDEVGDLMFARWPLTQAPALVSSRPLSSSSTPSDTDLPRQAEFDFGREMRSLRVEVDALLADGRVDEAELLMEQRRQLFVANGYYIRRINQAYFAFHGSYADTPASSDPIGPKTAALRDQSPTLASFLQTARQLKSEPDLNAALTRSN